MNKIIAVYDENNIITRILDIDLLDSIKNDTYKIFENSSNVSIGENVNSYDDEGNMYPNSKLFELGLLDLAEDEKLEGEEIRQLTEVEKYKTAMLKKDISIENKTIDTDENGNEYIRDTSVCCKQKTMLEKYSDDLISKDEYNEYQKEQVANKYQYTTDPMYQALSVRKMRGDITDDAYALEVEKIEAMIWHLPAVSVEIKSEFPYVE